MSYENEQNFVVRGSVLQRRVELKQLSSGRKFWPILLKLQFEVSIPLGMQANLYRVQHMLPIVTEGEPVIQLVFHYFFSSGAVMFGTIPSWN